MNGKRFTLALACALGGALLLLVGWLLPGGEPSSAAYLRSIGLTEPMQVFVSATAEHALPEVAEAIGLAAPPPPELSGDSTRASLPARVAGEITAPGSAPGSARSSTTEGYTLAASSAGKAGPTLQGGPILMSPPLAGDANFVVSKDSDRVWGFVGAGELVTVTVGGVQMGAARADGNGFFWTTLYAADGQRPNLSGGEAIAIYAEGTQVAGVTLRAITGAADPLLDNVDGVIGGVSSPLSVTVYTGWDEPGPTAYSQTVSTDGSGAFTVDFSDHWNMIADESPTVAYVENGIEVHQRVYAHRLIVLAAPSFGILGFAFPGDVLDITIYSATAEIREQFTGIPTDARTGQYNVQAGDLQVGDVVSVTDHNTYAVSRTVEVLTLPVVDHLTDRVTGVATPGATVLGRTRQPSAQGLTLFTTSAIADATGVYTLDFGAQVDLMPEYWAGVYVPDAEGDDLVLWAPPLGYVIANQTWDEVYGRVPAAPGEDSIGHPVTLTHYVAAEDATYTYNKGAGWYGDYYFNPNEDGLGILSPGDVITVESEGYAWQGVIALGALSAQHDAALDQITGEITLPGNRVEIEARQWNGYVGETLYPVGEFYRSLAATTDLFTFTTAGFDLRNAVSYDVFHRLPDENAEQLALTTDFICVWWQWNGVEGALGPAGTPFTLTLYDDGSNFKARITNTSVEPRGEIGWNDFNFSDQRIEPGDQLHVESAAGFDQIIGIPALFAEMDEVNDTISGYGPPNTLLNVNVNDEDYGFVPTDAEGNFTVAAAQLQVVHNGDVTWGGSVRLCTQDENANHVCQYFDWPQITAHYDRDGWNEVWGRGATPDSTLLITVSDELDQFVAGGSTPAGSGWEGSGSYQLNFPDGVIRPGYTVSVNFGDLVESVGVVELTAYPDMDTDILTGTAPANSTLYLNVDCQHGGCWNEVNNIPVDANGVFTVDMMSEVGYDINAGDNFNLHHTGDHNHQTQYSLRVPAAHIWIEKQQTHGFAAPGGTYIYRLRYGNYGDALAENGLITDALPNLTTYFTDTGGFPVEVGDGVITWTMGAIPLNRWPGDAREFYVALRVDESAPVQANLEQNCAWISSPTPGDDNPWDNQSCAGGPWVDNSTLGVGVNKWPYPSDPHPGQEFNYDIDYWNETGAASGPVWLTDTLPVSTTFVRWEEQWGLGALWTEVITTGGQVVLYAPTGFPGDVGGHIRLTLRLDADAPLGMRLENTIVITTPGDSNPDNNSDFDNQAQVSSARYDLRMNKNVHSGVLVPGGFINYGASYENQGNVAVHAWFTDTLPEHTGYQPGSAGYWNWGWFNFDPVTVTEDYVVWDLGVVGVGERFDFSFTLDVDPAAPTGPVENCAEVRSAFPDNTPWDNAACATQELYALGPNLLVSQRRDWHGNGRLHYELRVLNIGDENLTDVLITDTFPADTAFNGEWGGFQGWPGWGNQTFDQVGAQLIWGLEYFPSGAEWNTWINIDLDNPGQPMRWYTNTLEATLFPGDPTPEDNVYEDVAFSGGEVERVGVDVYGSHIWVDAAHGPLTITTATEEWVGGGDGHWDWNASQAILPGDVITIAAASGAYPVIITAPTPFDVRSSSLTDQVTGQIGGAAHETVQVQMDWLGEQYVQTDGSGSFTATFPDIPRGRYGNLNYETVIDYAQVYFHRRIEPSDLLITVNYAHNWVEGGYEAGHTVWLTVTNSVGDIKATAEQTTDVIPWWNGGTGFSTNIGDPWRPQQPDIEVGDFVHGALDNGYTTTVQIGEITGALDLENDRLTGVLNVPWFAGLLNGQCWIDGVGNTNQEFSAAANGGAYTCDFSDVWDLTPNESVSVQYQEPDGDWVRATFQEPTPRVRVQKWANDNPAQGGNLVFYVQYRNEGNGPATDVIITDTLQRMTYLTDTSGLPYTGGGDQVVWDLGTLAPGGWIQFEMFVQVDATQGEIVTNTADIATSNPYNQSSPEERHSEWSAPAVAGDAQLGVGTWPWTGDPAADTDVVFTVQVCNHGNTGSNEIELTDTLHPSMTLQTWWPQQSGWTEVSRSDHELVLSQLVLPGHNCYEVYVQARVSAEAQPGQEIFNTAAIASTSDTDGPDNNLVTWYGNIGEPHTNLNINKNWGWGSLVPGGLIYYNINYGNNGNVAVGSSIRITDTLPQNTTFVQARYHGGDNSPFTPIFTGTDTVIWELSGLDNGYNYGYWVELRVDSDATPGTLLTNTVEIQPLPGEDSYEDNSGSATALLNPAGANLRITKSSYWQNYGTQIHYDIQVENLGDQTVNSVRITDTYPLSTTFSGAWDENFWEDLWLTDNYTDGQLIWELERLLPGWNFSLNFNVNLDPAAQGELYRWYTNTIEITTPPTDPTPEDNVYQDVLFSGGEVNYVGVDVYGTNIWVDAPAGPIEIATASGSGSDGNNVWGWDAPTPLLPGDVITVTAGVGTHPVIITIPAPFEGEINSLTDAVTGQIDALDHEWVYVDVDGVGQQNVQTDGSGYFVAAFPDIPRGAWGNLNYQTEIDYAQVNFHRRLSSLDLTLNINYGHNWIEGSYEPGHTLWITVTEGAGPDIRATATLTTGVIPWWGGSTGFSTNLNDPWVGDRDMQAGDWVYARLDNGYEAVILLGEITGVPDMFADTISGVITASWLTGPLNANCGVWVENGPNYSFQIDDPNGWPYFCDFNAEWDLQPGEQIGVQYQEPDGHWIINTFAGVAPNLYVNKWGDGNPAAGGNFVFHLQYGNNGDGPAEDVVITDTLQGMTYLTDTSGLAHTGSGGQIVWNLDTVNPGADVYFDVYVSIDAAQDDWVVNTAEIATSNPFEQGDPGELQSQWSAQVVGNDTQLSVGKRAWTGDPAPDTDVVFTVNVCNNGSTASAAATLTDTLHPSMTLQTWWPQSPGWVEVSRGPQELVLSRPSVARYACSEVYVQVHISPAAIPDETFLTNTAEVTCSHNLEPHNTTSWGGLVRWPHTNLALSKTWNWGMLVPGGMARYNLNFHNTGNLPVGSAIRITDTLPTGTSFREARWHHDGSPALPLYADASIVVWEIPGLPNGYSGGLEVVLDIDPGLGSGSVLTNTAEIQPQPGEDGYEDNVATDVQTVYASGANLRVRQTGGWHNWGAETRQIEYQIGIENIGDQSASDITLTDTYPGALYLLNDTIDVNYWDNWQWGHDPANHFFTVTLQQLDPGQVVWVNFYLITDTNPIPEGLVLTNLAEITVPPSDPNPADNVASVTHTTGPDFVIEKELTGGELRPGELITFTLRYANATPGGQWWWNAEADVWITDTLPVGLEFVSASWWPHAVDGAQLAWNVGALPAGAGGEIEITARITETAAGGAVFTNTAEIASTRPDLDVEPYAANNHAEAAFAVLDTPLTVVQEITDPGEYTFGGTCARLDFSDVGSLNYVTITLAYDYPTLSRSGLPRHYEITGDGAGFTATLTLCYSEEDLAAAGIAPENEDELRLYRFIGGGAWESYTSTVDIALNHVSATVTGFSDWAIGTELNANYPTRVALHRLEAPANPTFWAGLPLLVAGTALTSRRKPRLAARHRRV